MSIKTLYQIVETSFFIFGFAAIACFLIGFIGVIVT